MNPSTALQSGRLNLAGFGQVGMNRFEGLFEFLPLAKPVQLLEEQGMFNHQLVYVGVVFPIVLEISTFIRVHFPADVPLNGF